MEQQLSKQAVRFENNSITVSQRGKNRQCYEMACYYSRKHIQLHSEK